jgi:hypothetical protein
MPVDTESIDVDREIAGSSSDTSNLRRDHEVNQFRENFDEPGAVTQHMRTSPRQMEIVAGAIVLLVWFGFFSAGLFIPTHAYRERLLQATSFWDFTGQFGHFVVVIGCYTVTNLLFLSCASAYLGCMTMRWTISALPDRTLTLYSRVSPGRIYSAAVLRGFFLYLLVISGLLTFSTESSIVDTSFGQYIRMAGIVSALAFTIGYDPVLINRFLGRLEDFANQPLKKQRQDR